MIRGGKSRNSAYDPHRIAPEKCGGGELRRRRARHRIRSADCRIFAPGEIVTGQEPDRNRRAPREERSSPAFRRSSAASFQPGMSGIRISNGIPQASSLRQVFQNRPVVRSGAFPVHAGIDRLEIEEEQVRPRQEPFEIAPRHIAAGIQRGVDSVVAELPEQRLAELRLKQRFPAGKRDASAGGLVEHPVGRSAAGTLPERRSVLRKSAVRRRDSVSRTRRRPCSRSGRRCGPGFRTGVGSRLRRTFRTTGISRRRTQAPVRGGSSPGCGTRRSAGGILSGRASSGCRGRRARRTA